MMPWNAERSRSPRVSLSISPGQKSNAHSMLLKNRAVLVTVSIYAKLDTTKRSTEDSDAHMQLYRRSRRRAFDKSDGTWSRSVQRRAVLQLREEWMR